MLRHPGNGASQASIVVCAERVRRSSGRACRRIVSLSAVGEAWRKIWLVPTTFNPEPGYGPAYPRLVATIFCAEQILCILRRKQAPVSARLVRGCYEVASLMSLLVMRMAKAMK